MASSQDAVAARVVVIGAGISGLVAGLRLAELGLKPLVLEQGEDDRYLCNTRIAGGAFHVAHHDVAEDVGTLEAAIVERTGGSARSDLVHALAADVGAATQWLKGKGVRFIRVGHEPYRRHTLAPPVAVHGRNYWEGRGGDVLLRTLEADLRRRGCEIARGSRAVRLMLEAGSCVGLMVEQGGRMVEIAADHIVICDGGFHCDPDLLREFITPAPERLKQRNARTGHGDGLRMARAAGAQLVGMSRFYGHVLAQDAMHNDDLSPFPTLDLVCSAGIVVDSKAGRFVDEGAGGITIANAIAAQPDPLGTIAVFDARIWEGAGREYLIPANPTLTARGGTLHSASSIGELAPKAGLPAEALEQTVAAYNDALAGGRTMSLAPGRRTDKFPAQPIRTAPFHAVRLCAGITYTMGGIAIDALGRVLDEADRPIPGLFAAGCAAGGLEGGSESDPVAYLGGLTRSTVFALRAANAIAAAFGKP